MDFFLFLNSSLFMMGISLGDKLALKINDEFVGEVNVKDYSNQLALFLINNESFSIPKIDQFECFSDYFKLFTILSNSQYSLSFADLYRYDEDECGYQSIFNGIKNYYHQIRSLNHLDGKERIFLICKCFGLKKEYIEDYLITNDLLEMQSNLYWSHSLLVDALNSLQQDDSSSFDYNVLKDYDYFFSLDSIFSQQTLSYWILNYFYNIFTQYPTTLLPSFISNTLSPILSVRFKSKTSNKWSVMKSNLQENQLKTMIANSIQTYTLQNNIDSSKYYLFFHGTSFDGVSNILVNGITLNKGSSHQDFSHNNGFYLFRDEINLPLVIQWIYKKYYNNLKSIIVYFIVKDQFDDNVTLKSLNCCHDILLSKEIIQFYRYTFKPLFTVDKYLEYDYIYGQLCQNGNLVAKGNVDPIQRNNAIQYCLRSSKSIELFNRADYGIIFYIE